MKALPILSWIGPAHRRADQHGPRYNARNDHTAGKLYMKRFSLLYGLLLFALSGCAVPNRSELRMVLQVHPEETVSGETESAVERLAAWTAANGIHGLVFKRIGDAHFEVIGEVDRLDQVSVHAGDILGPGFRARREPGVLVFEMTPKRMETLRELAVEQVFFTLTKRIDQLGIEDARVTKQAGDRIALLLPGIEDPQRTSRFLRTRALLELRFIRFPAGGGMGVSSREEILQAFGGQVPPELEILEGDRRDEHGKVTGTMYYAVEKHRVVGSGDFSDARPSLGALDEPIVEFRLKPEAAQVFGEATGSHVGSGLAIVLDGRVLTAPRIQSRITDAGIIEGGFTKAEAEDLALQLHGGALPFRVTVVEESVLRR